MPASRDAAARRRLSDLIARLAPTPGRHATPWPGLRCYRAVRPTVPDPTVYAPSLCLVAQGAKEARVGPHRFRYDPLQYLVVGASMPVQAEVVEASEAAPFLSLSLEIRARELRDLLLHLEAAPPPRWDGQPPLRVSPLDERLADAVLRLLEAVLDPLDRRVLAPAAYREIVYLVLRGEQGDLLRLAAGRDQRSPGVARALSYLHRHVDQRLDVATLARAAGMSVSSLHHGFKSSTTLSPIQYLKRIRLDRARQLLLEEGCQAGEAALRVGYESPSQFSREFKRLFGAPPRLYRERQARLLAGSGAAG